MRSPSIRKSFKRYLIGALACVLVLVAYYRDSWFRSSGDRAIARMHLSMNQPPPTDPQTSPRANAALISLVRNSELDGIISSMRYMEKSFNSKFQYPWIFFNDVPFTKEFMERTQAETDAPCTYELVPKEHWDVPEWINQTRMEEAFIQMASDGVKHATQLSYHKMCRWYSGFFFRHPALDKYRYYWRVEPDVKYFCDIEYDVFQFMAENNKTYGFTINIYDDPKSIPTLWPTTMDFLESHPGYALGANENSYHWLTDSVARPAATKTANGYSTCHFWSNFEIGDLDFWRSKTYTDYFDHLDRTGNFFYERWGDAPVHSVALGLFVPNEQIHWFRDIGYQHSVFSNCPGTDKCHGCQANKLTPLTYWLNGEDCRVNWFKQVCEISRNKGEVDEEMCGLGRKDHAFA